MWLLGSSDFSAHLAARLGLPYVFAHHFSGQGTAEALALYRGEFRPSEYAPAPRTFLTANVVVAESDDEAQRLLLPNLLAMAALRTGAPLTAQVLVEDAERQVVPPQQQAIVDAMRQRTYVGTPDRVAAGLTELAARFEVDEVMVHPVAGALTGTTADAAPARETTLALLAEALL